MTRWALPALLGLAGHWLLLLLVPWHVWQETRVELAGLVVPFYFPILAGSSVLLVLLCALAHPPTLRPWWPWALLVAATLPGIVLGGDAAWGLRSLASFAIRGFLPGLLLAWLLAGADAGWARRTLPLLSALALGLALLGLLEIFSRHGLVPQLAPASLDASRNSGDLAAHSLYRPSLTGGRLEHSFSPPPAGTAGNRLIFGSCLVAFVPLSLWGLRHGRPRPLHGAALVALVSCLLFTPARSAWLGAVAALSVYLLPGGLWRRHGRALVCAMTAAAATVVAVWIVRRDVLAEIQQKTLGFRLSEPSASIRLDNYRLCTRLDAQVVQGVGLGRAPDALQRPGEARLPAVDNQLLHWLLETGIVGAAALGLLLGLLATALYRGYRQAPDPALGEAKLALLGAITGMTVTFVFFDGFAWSATQSTYWALIGAGWALAWHAPARSPAAGAAVQTG